MKRIIEYIAAKSTFKSKRDIVVFLGIVIVSGFLIIGYKDHELTSIAISSDGELVAYSTMGYRTDRYLTLAKFDGTKLFEHELTSKEDAGGISIVWFEENSICVYSVRKKTVMSFSFDGTLLDSDKVEDFDYPDKMQGFKKKLSTAQYETSQGVYKYKNYDFISSFIFKKTRTLTFTNNDGMEFVIWEGE